MKNRKTIYAVITLIIAGFLYQNNEKKKGEETQVDNDGITDVVLNTKFDYLPSSTTGQIVNHDYSPYLIMKNMNKRNGLLTN